MTPMREAALCLLPAGKGIFLRCDRGESLYVTNTLSRTEEQIDWASAGFIHRTSGKLVYLSPEKDWIERFERWLEAQVKRRRLADTMSNASFSEVRDEDMALWIEGVKRLEMKGGAREYEKFVRQRAAVCLRERRGGGTLVSCALMIDLMDEGGIRNEA